jgi:NADH-quinone oxidoreductase subunit N
MNSALIWIILPLVVGVALLLLRRRPYIVMGVASGLCLFLVLIAWQLPPGSALRLGSITIQILPEFNILGRRFLLAASDRSFLILMYLFGGIWFLGSRQARALPYFPAVGLVLIAMLVAAQAVEPFLYSALILEMAVLVSLPLLSPLGSKAGGTLRYLVFQTLAIPFILLAGWAAGLVEANLPGTRWVAQAILFLGMGFAFWLAIFPFYTWVPLLAEETSPYIFGFLLGLLPVGVLWIVLGFLDSFAWLRSSVEVAEGLRLTGGIMVLTAGIWTAFQTDLSRSLGYAILMENGYALLAISLQSGLGLELFAASLLPRLVGIALWTLALSAFQKNGVATTFGGLSGTLRRYPVISAGLALAYFSIGGLPLLASFPIRQPLLETLAGQALPVTIAAVIGNLGFLFGGYRLLTSMASSDEKTWKLSESRLDAVMLLAAMLLLLVAGVFPWLVLRGSLGLVQVFTNLH